MTNAQRKSDPACLDDVAALRRAGPRIARRRVQLGYSATLVAHDCGITTGTLRALEHAEQPVAHDVVLMVARRLRIPAETLYTGDQPRIDWK